MRAEPMTRRALPIPLLLLLACVSHQRADSAGDVSAAPAPTARYEVRITRDVVYTPEAWPQPLSADLFAPVGAETPAPAVVLVHGGGWQTRTRDDMDATGRSLAERGYVAMSISYRLAPRWTFPAQIQDVQQAVLWLRANAAGQGVRSDRMASWGYSEVAHLAALVGVTGPGDALCVAGARVLAVVAGGTPVDVRYYKRGSITNTLMGVPYDTDPELWRQASPAALVTQDDPPTFLYHGTFDFWVPVGNAHAMYAELSRARVPRELYRIRGLEHYSMFYFFPAERGIDFLDRHLR